MNSHTRRLSIAWLLAALGMLATPALAQDENHPKKAKKVTFELVRGYQPCLAPNDSTPAFGIPACSPPVPQDSQCDGFTPSGSGKLSYTVKGEGPSVDATVKASLKGLRPGCEGETLCFAASYRNTTRPCTSGAPECTEVDAVDNQLGFPDTAGCCVVANGRCKFKAKATDMSGRGSGPSPGTTVVNGCALMRNGAIPFRCGLFIP